jgi:Ras-related protein Rab-7A
MQYKSTIGADFLTKEVNIDGTVIQLQLWDTAGAERYNSMGPSFYRNSECCALVCDLTDEKSFEAIDNWRTEFLNQLSPKNPENYPFVLLCNKCDKIEERKVQEIKIKKYSETKNIPYFEASAKNSRNVESAFEEVARLALKRNIKEDDILFIPDRIVLKTNEQKTQDKNCCKI